MAETEVLAANPRQGSGSRIARRLRKGGNIPAVLYGHKQDTVPLQVSTDDLSRIIRHGARVVDLKLGSGVETAQIVELQWDHLGKEVLHVDFKRVSRDERIEVDVRIELRGIAPGVAAGGVLDQPMHSLKVECLAIAIPDSLRVPIGELQLSQSIHVRDVKAPEGVKILNDPDTIVVQVKEPTAEAEAGTEPTGAIEPEVIGRKPEEEGEAEE